MSKQDEVKKLKKIWYNRLKESGFEDIETDEFNLKTWSTEFYRKKDWTAWQSVNEYYRLASIFLQEHKFINNLERIIWEYHANGISARNIALLLKQTKVADLEKSNVNNRIRALRTIMKKQYLIEPFHE